LILDATLLLKARYLMVLFTTWKFSILPSMELLSKRCSLLETPRNPNPLLPVTLLITCPWSVFFLLSMKEPVFLSVPPTNSLELPMPQVLPKTLNWVNLTTDLEPPLKKVSLMTNLKLLPSLSNPLVKKLLVIPPEKIKCLLDLLEKLSELNALEDVENFRLELLLEA